MFILPGLAALFLWVYYSILGWTVAWPKTCRLSEWKVIPTD